MPDALEDAVVAIVARDAGPMHWTVVLDRALRDGAVPPSPDARDAVLRALASAARGGRVEKVSTGTYRAAAV